MHFLIEFTVLNYGFYNLQEICMMRLTLTLVSVFSLTALPVMATNAVHLADALTAGKAFLAANQHKPGVKTTASGLQYKILKEGSGTAPTLKDTVTVNYEGTFINGKVFDSSYKRDESVTFPVKGVIKGWQEALTMMKPGAIWMLYIPPDLAYGANNAPAAIGANQTLIFKVNLISVKR
jgi:FKBP-type peptidyl-prolyl cis-trans isomerase